MLYLIGLGINDEQDLSLKAVEALKKCDEIYCELYTGHWQGDLKKLEKIVGKEIIMLKRERVESDFLLEKSKGKNVALLVSGDPLTATTHIELLKKDVEIIHASSIFTAVAETGLQLYKFGRATTLPKPEAGFKPTSPYDVIEENYQHGLHTLVLLDTDGEGMSVKEGLEVLKELEEKKEKDIIKDNKILACSSLGGDRMIKYDSAENLMNTDFTKPAVIIIPGKLNFKEEEALKLWA